MAVIKMDWQKNILIAAILAVLFTLAIRWNSFQEKHTPAPTPSATVSTQTNHAVSDIPTLPANPDIKSADTPSSNSTSTLIEVSTDSLKVNINAYGGDIVKVALPRHSADIKTPEIPFVLLDNTSEHTYIAQSGIIGANATDTKDGRPTFTVEKNQFTLEEGKDTLVVDLHLQQDQVNIIKRFTFTRGQYLIAIEYLIDNKSNNPWSGILYGQIKRDSKIIAPTSSGIGLSPYLGGAVHTAENNYKKVTFDDLKKSPLEFNEKGGWISLVQHYFITAWIPSPDTTNKFSLQQFGDKDLYLFRFTGGQVDIAPNSQGHIKASFYAGPKDTAALEKISPYLDLTVDYGFLWMIAKPLFAVLKFIQPYLLSNWGLAIIGLTVIVKALFFHLSATSYKSMAKMRKLAPKMAELKERYGEDRQKMSQETMKLYQTEKVNPLGGCLPMLIQMPVFLALYWVLMESVELRHAPFVLWIKDLSIQDPYFVLPLIYGVTMWFMQKLNPQPTDPMQARVMQMLPLVFTFMFLWFPAGLVLYWVTNNTLSIVQQYYITRQIENADLKKAKG